MSQAATTSLSPRRGSEIRIAALRTSMRLAESIYDKSGVLLLAAGAEITPRFIRLLEQRNITYVSLLSAHRRSVIDPDRAYHAELLDADLDGALEQQPTLHRRSESERNRLSLRDLRSEARRGLEKHVAASNLIAEVCQTLEADKPFSVAELSDAVGEFVDMVLLDADILPLVVSLQHSGDEYLFDHCVNVALVSITLAAGFGMPRDRIAELGLGALLQDIGMIRVPDEIRLAPRPLTQDEWFEIRRHPFYTIDILDKIRDLPPVSKYIGYQVHERADGSGYPRRRSGMLIHRYARIAAVADAYAAMTRRRPYRDAMLPYLAAKSILVESSAKKFDGEVVRGFLDNLSMVPIGSIVELNNGDRATVMRAIAGAHTCPVVELVDSSGQPTGRIIDLSSTQDRRVIRAVPDPMSVVGHHR